MRTCERFAEDVLWRIQREKKQQRQRRRILGTVAVLGAVFLLVTVIQFGVGQIPVTDQPLQTEPPLVYRSTIRSLYYSDGNIRDEMFLPGHTVFFRINARDVGGYDPQQVEQLRAQEQHKRRKAQDTWLQHGYSVRSSVLCLEDTLISYLATNGFVLQLEDWGEVTAVTAACSSPYGQVEVGIRSQTLSGQTLPYRFMAQDGTLHQTEKTVNGGVCWLYGQQVTLSGDVCRTIYEDVQKGAGSLTLTWKPGGELLQALTEDPSFALPDHTVSFAVDYENGRSEVHTLTIHYADGEGYVHYDGVRER